MVEILFFSLCHSKPCRNIPSQSTLVSNFLYRNSFFGAGRTLVRWSSTRTKLALVFYTKMNVQLSTEEYFQVLPKGGVASAKGFKTGGVVAGLKSSGQLDLALVLSTVEASVAGVFTKSIVKAAPVLLCERFLKDTKGKATCILINSGQANAATGEEGLQDALDMSDIVSSCLPEIPPTQVLVASTGVIGKRVDLARISKAVPSLVTKLGHSDEHNMEAARAIMTTDLVPKYISVQWESNGRVATLGGMAKGSGMIHPDMGTMLSFLTTDIAIDSSLLHEILQRVVNKSFNAITVDGDTSTNDSVLIMANGLSRVPVEENSPELKIFEKALMWCCEYLAKAIARDGEGATCLIQVEVSGTSTDEDAQRIARKVSSSTLWKAAVYGRDPNWGRILAAAGSAGVDFDAKQVSLWLGEYRLVKNGLPLSFDKATVRSYMQAAAEAKYLSGEDQVNVYLKVGDGFGYGKAWGCDLSYEYVRINAEYTT
ncbi:bifunctional glutamate N-acetyltransferase / amino-acid N-acetyltransferase [Galdieria sulphuraria]|uniref:Arginine biosynthesis bifunctional protein ArgJ, mitochondrial n=1 Tax=Galdieria sulphuraria TaxID=130081 RepID=M2W8E5_GALSU|nr:bifunctional glutamate N-acetyltransferase / amino-acid N-acetyltransferase [Galdieria sulphuraria]EME32151.1 bifunctional glutamate N-acetyltransferase / amino-acid N-acetyltransferase [Galdieria sulphuraria]|eukprot:XP_005708671.1 bifunctional glutamate N-acetyltransferase / amino-acid N-acetyltransferase [Galdieria sulphuraria]